MKTTIKTRAQRMSLMMQRAVEASDEMHERGSHNATAIQRRIDRAIDTFEDAMTDAASDVEARCNLFASRNPNFSGRALTEIVECFLGDEIEITNEVMA